MKRRGCLGCSFPVLVIIGVVTLVLILVGVVTGPIGNNLLNLPDWLVVHQPHVQLEAEPVFDLLSFPAILYDGTAYIFTNTFISTWLTIAVLVIFFWLALRKSKLIPGRLQGMAEAILGWILGVCEMAAGEKNGRKFFPLIATIFLFVIVNAYLSLLPIFNTIMVNTTHGSFALFRGANTDANVPLTIAIFSFVFVEYTGFRALKFSYVKKFINVGQFVQGLKDLFRGRLKSGFGGLMLGVINIFVGIIELVTEVIRIVSFTFRLFGNMTAGEILLGIIMFLIPWLLVSVFYGLELLIGFIQAFIFSGLTLAFATLAGTGHQDEHA